MPTARQNVVIGTWLVLALMLAYWGYYNTPRVNPLNCCDDCRERWNSRNAYLWFIARNYMSLLRLRDASVTGGFGYHALLNLNQAIDNVATTPPPVPMSISSFASAFRAPRIHPMQAGRQMEEMILALHESDWEIRNLLSQLTGPKPPPPPPGM